jgi:class 3 adenylate cyclase
MIDDVFPEIRYADADGVAIAYAIRGQGPVDVVLVPHQISLIGTMTDPVNARLNDRLASFARLIRLDKRGMGSSDPMAVGTSAPLEQQVSDVVAVMDAVGSPRAALYGVAAGASVALLCAASHPERVRAVVLHNARYFRADPDTRPRILREVRAHWGDLDHPWSLDVYPTQASDPRFVRALGRTQQATASKSAAVAGFEVWLDSDIRPVLPLVHVPTLVVYAEGIPFFAKSGEYLAQHLPNARTYATPGADSVHPDHADELAATIEEFLTGIRSATPTDRILATVLFTDIVASTETLAALGDQQWRQLLDTHDRMLRGELARAGGREIKQTGDGFLATFDGPARAISCAAETIKHAADAGLTIRVGIHVGECERRGDDLAGIAIHTCARVCALAPPGTILVTSTVKDLTAGSGITYTDQGTHDLKGIPDPIHLYQAN